MPGLVVPLALALLPLLGVVAVMYMLKLRREDQRVPSTLLWRAVVQDPPANAPWQRLRMSLLLLLQLLALTLLILALARPYLPTDEPVGENLVVLLDRSASMAATDVSPSRLEAAKRELLDLVTASAGARVTVIAFDETMDVLASAETDPSVIRRAVADVAPVPVEGDITDALTFASALAEGQEDAQIVVLSDGRFALTPDTLAGAPVRYVRVGESGDNQAISALSVSEGAGGGPPELFVQVANAGGETATRRVEVRVNDALYDARDVALSPGAREAFSLALPDDVVVVEARLKGDDALPLDDAAWAVPPRPAQARVVLISEGNRFLETAIGLLPSVESLARRDAADMDAPYGLTDVAVLDGLVPDPLPPGNLLLVGPTASTTGVTYLGALSNPVPRVVDEVHPLVAGTEMDQVSVLSASALELGPEWTPVVVADVGDRTWPLIAHGTIGGAEAVLVAFDVRQSDLPLRPAFPLLTAAAMEILAPTTIAGVPAGVPPGDPVALRLAPRATAVRITDPDGRRHALAIENGAATFADTDRLGVYAVEVETEDGVEEATFAVNLAGPGVSDVRPASEVEFALVDADQPGMARSIGREELWWPLALLGLGLLVAEWGYYHRRTLRELGANGWGRRRRGQGAR